MGSHAARFSEAGEFLSKSNLQNGYSSYEPQAFLECTDWQTCDGEIKVGHGIQGLPGSVDGYMNLQLANTEEYIDGTLTGNLGRCLSDVTTCCIYEGLRMKRKMGK